MGRGGGGVGGQTDRHTDIQSETDTQVKRDIQKTES